MKKVLFLSLYLLYSFTCFSQLVVINEFMASNDNFLLDEDGDNSDWIELYNTTSSPINLKDYYLSDDVNDLTQWALPDINIQANGFILLFASDKDRSNPSSELHTNFKIKSSGEALFLSYNNTIVHTIPSISLNTNTSYGYYSDGNTPLVVFSHPTPAAPNNPSTGLANQLSFSQEGGVYESVFDLTITSPLDNTTIYYTIDGSTPDTNSFKYTIPLALDPSFYSPNNISVLQNTTDELYAPPHIDDVLKTIVIRAAAFNTAGEVTSNIATHTYLFKSLGMTHTLPIVSICVDTAALFNYETGIFVPGIHWDENNPNWTGNYYQRGEMWEKPIHLEFYENNNDNANHIRQDAGIRTHGGNGRRFAQKTLRLYAREAYGVSNFDYPLFSDKPMDAYKRLILRPFHSSWSGSGISDHLANKMAIPLNIDGVASRPVVVYLNGEYWGIYFLQERIDERYIENNFGVDKDSVYTEEWGNRGNFRDITNYIDSNDLSTPAHYEMVKNWIDIDNFIDYQLFEIFIANNDWPANNVKFWRPKTDGRLWRWIFFDGDAGFIESSFDGFEQALSTKEEGEALGTHAGATLFLRRLLENESFKSKFLTRLEELLNNELAYETVQSHYHTIITQLETEIPNQQRRFTKPSSLQSWRETLENTMDFLAYRACHLEELTEAYFDYELDLPFCQKAELALQDISISPNPNNGQFQLKFNSAIAAPAQLIIFNALGQPLWQDDIIIVNSENVFQFEHQQLPNGVLFVSILTAEQAFSVKMVCINP